MNPLFIFDLDGTVIDSSHRVAPCLLPDGDLCLATYRERACTPEAVAGDTLLPLASVMQTLLSNGADVAICTARYMYEWDYAFLMANNLMPSVAVFSRDTLPDYFSENADSISALPDPEYKGHYFAMMQRQYPGRELIIYDDHGGVLRKAGFMGIRPIDAISINNRIEAFHSEMFAVAELLEA